MRYPDPASANFTRGYAWWLLNEAKGDSFMLKHDGFHAEEL